VDERLKRRLVGAAVLVSLIVIFVPMLLEDRPQEQTAEEPEALPDRAETEGAFVSPNVLPLEGEKLSQPPPAATFVPPPAPEPFRGEVVLDEAETTVDAVPTAVPQVDSRAEPVAGRSGSEPEPAPRAEPEPPMSHVARPAEPSGQEVAKASASPQAWVVQVGSFSNEKNAVKLVGELVAARFPAFREDAHVGGKTVYRVRVGPEVDRKRAEAMASGIGKRFKLKCQVLRYP